MKNATVMVRGLAVIFLIAFLAMPVCAMAQAAEGAGDNEASPPPSQPAPAAAGQAVSTAPAVYQATTQSKPWLIDPDGMTSLFFTPWTRALIKEARLSALTRPPTQMEMNSDSDLNANKDPGVRELSLGGIVFVKAGDWTIWLNSQRITPKALPRELLDLKVHKQYIEMKWYDAYTNQVFPVRLRTHQRFNLDTRIFLPG